MIISPISLNIIIVLKKKSNFFLYDRVNYILLNALWFHFLFTKGDYFWPEMGKKGGGGGGWFSSVKKVFKQSPNRESPEKKVSLIVQNFFFILKFNDFFGSI